MLSLVPGVSEPTEQHSQFFNAAGSVQMNTYGQPRMGNNYQTEGIDNNERTGLLQIMIPPKEAIQQVSVSTSNHDPELGRGTGAVSNVVLKSGTNNLSRRGVLEPAEQRHQQPQFLQSRRSGTSPITRLAATSAGRSRRTSFSTSPTT